MALPINAAQDITIVLDGNVLEFDVSPMNIDGRVMVPMRAIFEALGADVQWNEESEAVIAERDGAIVRAIVGDINMRVNEQQVEMDIAPMLVEGRTLVPIRFVSEAFGAEVSWDEARRVVSIRSVSQVMDLPVQQIEIVHIERVRFYTVDENIGVYRAPYSLGGAVYTVSRLGSAVTVNAYTVNSYGERWYRVTGGTRFLGDVWVYGGYISRTNPVPPRIPTPLAGRLTVRYHANGGIGAPISNTRDIEADGSVRFRHPFSEPRKDGYVFLGWRFENDMGFGIEEPGGRVLVLDLDPCVNEVVTYFAQWERG